MNKIIFKQNKIKMSAALIDSEKNNDLENSFKIMVATDIHLGCHEKDPIRGDDSFIAFEEILELSVQNEVDFILLGGDLFHDATPSQSALHKCLSLLRKYVLGDKSIEFELLSDQSLNFTDSLNKKVNYEDPNMNISIPIFSIHGNHDDPSGFGRLSSLDLLSVSGLVNYFGKCIDLTQINISPILMKKGETQLALYGLSHIHDNRLVRLLNEFKVVMGKPDNSSGDWFNIMVLHQNRADRGPKNYIPEKILPEFLNLVIWGHEHDCRIIPENIETFYVTQPGSTVATSLSEGEALQKHCGILYVRKDTFKVIAIPLKTVRPFIFESINALDYIDDELNEIDIAKKVMEIAREKVEEMIKESEEKLTNDPRQPKLPLIRLRICYTDESQMFNHIRFGQQYNERIANPADVILFKRVSKVKKFDTKEFDKNVMAGVLKQEDIDSETRVEEVVDRYFEEVGDSKKLQLMSSKILSEMCFRIVERNDINAAEEIMEFYKTKSTDFLMENMPQEDELENCISKFKQQSDIFYGQVLKMLDERDKKKSSSNSCMNNLKNKTNGDDDPTNSSFSNFCDLLSSKSLNTTEKNQSGKRGSRGSRGGRARGSKRCL